MKSYSVRSLLLLLAIALTTLPVLLYGVLDVFDQIDASKEAANGVNRTTAMLIERDLQAMIDQYQTLFRTLALDIDPATLRARNPERLLEVMREYPAASGMAVLDVSAVSVAGYSPTLDIPAGLDFSDREYAAEVLAGGRTAVSGNVQGRITGEPAIVFAVPLVGDSNELRGMVAGSVPAGSLAGSYALDVDQFAMVVDGLGRSMVSNATSLVSMHTEHLQEIVTSLGNADPGFHTFTTHHGVGDVYVSTVPVIDWKIFVGTTAAVATARSREAIWRAARLALICAIFGAGVAVLVSLSTGNVIRDIGQQARKMSPTNLRQIVIGETRLLPSELQSLVANFNNLLDRTARAKLAELEAISQVGAAILITRADGIISYTNEAGHRLLGDISGRNITDIIGVEPAKVLFFQGRASEWKGETVVRREDQSTFDGFLSATPILDDTSVSSIVVIIQDITQQKAERDSFTQTEKMITLGELVAGTSHELNNPLAIVTGYSDLLLEDGDLSQEQRAKIESIRKNALRASSVVHSLLAFARKRKPERVNTDINEVVDLAVRLKEYDLLTSGVRLQMEAAEALRPVFVDPNQIQQVLLNVLNNAQDAVLERAQDPLITVRTRATQDNVFVEVEDNGNGIQATDLKKVFDPFFTTKPVGKGTGLGLSISYGILREHGGDISIHSEPGCGAQVIIRIPVESRTSAAAPDAEPAVLPMGRPLRVLVVDDELEIVRILRSGMAKDGFTVDVATSITEALRLASGSRTYDFILTDVKMPGGSGIDLYRQLCTIRPAYRTRTVFLTGDTSNPATVQFLEKEKLAYFSKPFDFQAMERFLRETAGA